MDYHSAAIPPQVRVTEMKTYTVKRQDDHGNIFEVGSFENREDAERVCRALTEKGHKQMYWVEED